ncbi:hypothetical protein MMC11_003448 [Xylographa trunciseda]|nr:hypothetical protein [Xylographa trunciseda]
MPELGKSGKSSTPVPNFSRPIRRDTVTFSSTAAGSSSAQSGTEKPTLDRLEAEKNNSHDVSRWSMNTSEIAERADYEKEPVSGRTLIDDLPPESMVDDNQTYKRSGAQYDGFAVTNLEKPVKNLKTKKSLGNIAGRRGRGKDTEVDTQPLLGSGQSSAIKPKKSVKDLFTGSGKSGKK